jgi:hypothetical protein
VLEWEGDMDPLEPDGQALGGKSGSGSRSPAGRSEAPLRRGLYRLAFAGGVKCPELEEPSRDAVALQRFVRRLDPVERR